MLGDLCHHGYKNKHVFRAYGMIVVIVKTTLTLSYKQKIGL